MSLDEALGWIALALILVTMGVSLWALATHPRGLRVRCPGRCRGLRAWLDPRLMFIRGTCWYDLTGLRMSDAGCVRCPECGLICDPRQRRTDGRRLRVERVAALSLLGAIGAFAGPWIRGGCWTRSIPTLALAVIDRTGGVFESRKVQCEISERVYAGKVSGLAGSILAEKLVRELRDDSTKWNGHRALNMLGQLGPEADAALMRTLAGGDDQARILAARLLRSRQFEPTDELLRACVEDLRDDAGLVDPYLCGRNATAAAEYLVMHALAAREFLREAMERGDRQQRLLAAAVAGHAGLIGLVDQAAPILVEHLRNNDVEGDARVAAPALFRFGEAALPYLYRHQDSADAQLRGIARSIIERIEHPKRSIHALRNPMPRITERVSDPLADLSITQSARDLGWPRASSSAGNGRR